MRLTLPLLLAMAAVPAWAQSAPIDSSDVEVAAQAYAATYPMGKMIEEMRAASIAQAPPAQKATLERAFEAMDVDALQREMTALMAKHFDAGELWALADFYGSPEGRSVLRKMPVYMAEFQPFLQQQVMQALGAVRPPEE